MTTCRVRGCSCWCKETPLLLPLLLLASHTRAQFATSGLQPLRPLVIQSVVHSVHGSWYVFRLFFLSPRVAPLVLSMSHESWVHQYDQLSSKDCVSRCEKAFGPSDCSPLVTRMTSSSRKGRHPSLQSFLPLVVCQFLFHVHPILLPVVVVVAPEMRPLLPPLIIRDPVCRCSSSRTD